MKLMSLIAAVSAVFVMAATGCAAPTKGASYGNAELAAHLDCFPLATDDYMVQCDEPNFSIFDEDGKLSETVTCETYIIHSYNVSGEEVQYAMLYEFGSAADAERSYNSLGGDARYALSDNCIILSLNYCGSYKQDAVELLDSYDEQITYFSEPQLSDTQKAFSVPEHEVTVVKG